MFGWKDVQQMSDEWKINHKSWLKSNHQYSMFLWNPSTFQKGIVDEIEKILGPELGQIWRIAYANSSCVKKTELGRCLLVYWFGGCSKETPKMDKPGEDDQVAQRRRGTWADGQDTLGGGTTSSPKGLKGLRGVS